MHDDLEGSNTSYGGAPAAKSCAPSNDVSPVIRRYCSRKFVNKIARRLLSRILLRREVERAEQRHHGRSAGRR